MELKVGDRVEWCGVKGKVVKIWGFKSEMSANVEVHFETRCRSNSYTIPQIERFMPDGRLHYWHSEASLKRLGK